MEWTRHATFDRSIDFDSWSRFAEQQSWSSIPADTFHFALRIPNTSLYPANHLCYTLRRVLRIESLYVLNVVTKGSEAPRRSRLRRTWKAKELGIQKRETRVRDGTSYNTGHKIAGLATSKSEERGSEHHRFWRMEALIDGRAGRT